MKPETLEKLLEHIKLASTYSGRPRNDVLRRVMELENELRALVKAESEPGDVQSEGRSEWRPICTAPISSRSFLVFCSERRNIYTANHPSVNEWRHFGGNDEMMETPTHWMPLPAPPNDHLKPHNPDNLPSPGEGYRFLDEDEVGAQWNRIPFIHAIERWEKPGWSASCWQGSIPVCTYRTRLTREQLAQKRKEAGK